MTIFLKLALFGKCTGISFVDSTCIPVIHNKRFFSMKVFKNMVIATKQRDMTSIKRLYEKVCGNKPFYKVCTHER